MPAADGLEEVIHHCVSRALKKTGDWSGLRFEFINLVEAASNDFWK
jgi:hypothetical protein